MNEIDRPTRAAGWCAYVVASLFVIGLARFAFPGSGLSDGSVVGAVVAAAPHLVLLIGVWPRLHLPRWVAAAGLVWLLVDLASDVLAVTGAAPSAFLAVRYVGHIFAAVWISGLAVRMRGATRVIGVVLAVLLGSYTAVAAWVPPIALAPTGPLLVIWWLLVGRTLMSDSAHGFTPRPTRTEADVR